MERVVYLLGAGFSAPLGLPVMNNFLSKSKDMYFEDRERYKHFNDVFKQIRDFSVIKHYYDSDQFNIEEILSILEMASQLEGKRLKKNFIKYLSDVINFYTPTIQPYLDTLPSNWHDIMFGSDNQHKNYGYFYAGLLNLCIRKPIRHRVFGLEPSNNVKAFYAVITLNYDRVLENYSDHISSFLNIRTDRLTFRSEFSDSMQSFSERPFFAKLHGSVELDNIVPPTWSKGVDQRILSAWRIAYLALIEATQIRIIGYSLPEADAYVKYLLKSAVMKAPHLKHLDVLCLDPSGEAHKKYDEFVKFPFYRFVNRDVTDYLASHRNIYRSRRDGDNQVLEVISLEDFHHDFFKTHANE
ncbi:MAG: hypothetical protein P8X58_08195 [Syntrophobacterales bacterium]